MTQIPFNKTMTLDKRNAEGAYLIQGVFDSGQQGLYPAVEFSNYNLPSIGDHDIVGRENIFIFTSDGTDTHVYQDSAIGSPIFKYTITGVEYAASTNGNDGVHMVAVSGEYYQITTSSATLIDTITGADDTRAKMVFDGQYYFIVYDQKIYRGLTSAIPVERFANTGGDVYFIDVYNSDIVFITDSGLNSVFNLWAKDSSTLLEKQFAIPNSVVLGIGVVDGSLMLVKSTGQWQNNREQYGNIVALKYNGENFQFLNSIKAGAEQVGSGAMAIGSDYILVAIQDNNNSGNDYLYKNFLLKVKNNGAMEVIGDPAITETLRITTLFVHYNFISFGMSDASYYKNIDLGSGTYNNYTNFDETKYISNFIPSNNGNKREKLYNIGFSFEKLFDNEGSQETLDVYVRFSERDDFHLIGQITAEKVKDYTETKMPLADRQAEYDDEAIGLTSQIYEFTEKDIDGEVTWPLDTFQEIQFFLHSKNGFSITKGWYNE